ncbi:MAG: alanine racemase [Vulcanimicrobiaceae bacterium]
MDGVVRANARRWREHAGVPVWAVVKANGYGWGASRIVRAVEDEIEGFFVADAAEASEIRPLTTRPIAVLAATGPDETIELLRQGSIPNVASLDALAAAGAWAQERAAPARIRVGIVPAAGWSGLLEDAVEPFARAAGTARVEIELWTHLTAPELWDAQRRRFESALRRFRDAGAAIAGTDVASTLASAREKHSGASRVRIGIGLFGASLGGPQLECAIRIDATVTDVLPSDAVASTGYRAERITAPWLAVVRCGYSDGLPSRLAGRGDILSVGMQYAVLARSAPEKAGQAIRLLDTSSDLCMLLENTGISPHEFVVGLGR